MDSLAINGHQLSYQTLANLKRIQAGAQDGLLFNSDENRGAYNQEYSLAFKKWSPLAQVGNADAEYVVGVLYYNIMGITKKY